MTDAIPISSAKLDELLEQRRKDFERIAQLEAALKAAERHIWRFGGGTNHAYIVQLESALQLIGNELSLHADQGPAGEAFRALLNPTFRFPLEGGK